MTITEIIPKELLTAAGSVIATGIMAYLAHVSKAIPFKIQFGFKQPDFITKESLVANCEARQFKLDKKLDEKFDKIEKALLKGNDEFAALNKTLLIRYSDLAERISWLEGQAKRDHEYTRKNKITN
jgi:hypothetical protein